MRKKEKYYLVEYEFYHYNTGRANNGTRTARRRCETFEEAKHLKEKIDIAYGCDYNELPLKFRNWIDNFTDECGFIKSRAKVIAKYEVEFEIKMM